jgi:hypothetical protein
VLAPARAGLPVFEYAANLVKKSVTGAGHADKRQIAMMVGRLLPGVEATADAADALAVAICHAHHRATAERVEAAFDRQLKGIGRSVDDGSAVIDVDGVGYLRLGLVAHPARPRGRGQATLLVETIVREDAIALYGFLETAERDWFRILTTCRASAPGWRCRSCRPWRRTRSPAPSPRRTAQASAARPGVGPSSRPARDRAQGQGGGVRRGAGAGTGRRCRPAAGRFDQRGCRVGAGQSRLPPRRGVRRRGARRPAARRRRQARPRDPRRPAGAAR